jgi:hypothetical protein
MRRLQKHGYTDYNKDKEELPRETLQRPGSGVMFDDDFVGALAQRLVQRMQTDLPDRSRTDDKIFTALRLLLAVLSLLAFVAVIVIVLKIASLAWWMVLAILSITGAVFVLINATFQLPRR